MAHIDVDIDDEITREVPSLDCLGADNIESLGLVIVVGETSRTDAKLVGAKVETISRGGRVKGDTLNGAGASEDDTVLTVGGVGVEDGVTTGTGSRASDPVAPGGPRAGSRTTAPNHLSMHRSAQSYGHAEDQKQYSKYYPCRHLK